MRKQGTSGEPAPDAEPAPYPYDPERCPFTATWNVLGGKWKGLIWWRLSAGLVRFGQLQRSIPQATRKVLTQQLRELERDGIVSRRVYPEVPPRVEYQLTEYGRTLGPVIESICDWGQAHLLRRGGGNGDGTLPEEACPSDPSRR